MDGRRQRPTWLTWLLCGAVVSTSFAQAQAKPRTPETVRRPITRDMEIDGVPCAKTGRAPAEFWSSGRLLECPLSRDAVIATQPFPKGSWVIFHADGSLNGAWLSRHAPMSGHVCKGEGYKKWSLRFHPGGALKSCYLPETTVIEGVPCRDGTFWGRNSREGRKRPCISTPMAGWPAVRRLAIFCWTVKSMPRGTSSCVTAPGARRPQGDDIPAQPHRCWSTKMVLPSGSTSVKLAGPLVPSSASVVSAIPLAFSWR